MINWGDDGKSKTPKMGKFFQALNAIKLGPLFKSKALSYKNLITTLSSSLFTKILMGEAIVLTYKEFFTEDIVCYNYDPPKMTSRQFLDYCMLEGIYTVFTDSSDVTSAYTGVTSLQVEDGSKFYHRYYKWVYISLIIQAVMFYSTKWIWNYVIDKRVTELLRDLDSEKKNLYEYQQADQVHIVQSIADLLFTNVTFYNNVIISEILCLIHLLIQIWATDRFLNGNFQRLGILWLQSSYSIKSITSALLSSPSSEYPSISSSRSVFNAYDPLQLIFPRMVKCTVHIFGLSGDLNAYDGLCFLSANTLIEKVYLFQWFLYHILLLTIIFILIYRALILTIPQLRFLSLAYTSSWCVAKSFRPMVNSPGRWFLLHLLSTSLSLSNFIDLMNAVNETHFDKYGNPLNNSIFGKFAKENPTLVTTRDTKKNKSNDKSKDKATNNGWTTSGEVDWSNVLV